MAGPTIPRVTRRTPQDKKALSFEKDRRNAYGENDKSSRKAIPFRKRWVNKTNRHADSQALHAAEGPHDESVESAVDDRVHGRRPKRWAKTPDESLGDHLARRRSR
jgi:hypothetical protein